jgi:hypothetical protein
MNIATIVSPVTKGVQAQLWVYTDIFPLASWVILCVMVAFIAVGFHIIYVSGKIKSKIAVCAKFFYKQSFRV